MCIYIYMIVYMNVHDMVWVDLQILANFNSKPSSFDVKYVKNLQ